MMVSLSSTKSDSRLDLVAPAFRVMRTRRTLGSHRFPTNDDYYAIVGALSITGVLDEIAAVGAQRDWFQRGQTGCLFARLAANLSAESWPYLVWGSHEFDASAAVTLDAELDELALDGSVEMVSLLFPACKSIQEFRDIALGLVEVTKFWLEEIAVVDDEAVFQVRRSLSPDLDAWVMGFGPDESFPETRQAPFYELAIRTKSKSAEIFHRLNQDRGVAHLADFPLEMPEHHWEHRWASTESRTRAILGHEPTAKSAARSTFSVPLMS
jgi:hypothetical protein